MQGHEIARKPLYKYSKEAKERFLKDPSLAFLFMYFLEDTKEEEGDRERALVLHEFEALAMQTLRSSQCLLFYFILHVKKPGNVRL